MGFRPLHDWALIRREEPADRTSGGIIIPDSAKDKPAEGVVLAIGPGKFVKEKGKKEKKFIATVLKPGERVMFIEYMAKDVEVGSETITLIREEDILGTVEGEREVMVKPAYEVEARQERPPMVQPSPKVSVAAGTARKTPAKAGAKEPAAKMSPAKAVSKPGGRKTETKTVKTVRKAEGSAAKAAKKTAKPAPGEAVKKKAAPKAAAAKLKSKTKSPKAAAKMASKKKTVSKKPSAKTAVKKAVARKSLPKATGRKSAAGKPAKAKGKKK